MRDKIISGIISGMIVTIIGGIILLLIEHYVINPKPQNIKNTIKIDNKEPNSLGRAVFKTLKENDADNFLNFLPTTEDLKEIMNHVKPEHKNKKQIPKEFRTNDDLIALLKSARSASLKNFYEIRDYGIDGGIQWELTKIDNITIEMDEYIRGFHPFPSPKVNEIFDFLDVMRIYITFLNKGRKYEIIINNCIKLSRGWVIGDINWDWKLKPQVIYISNLSFIDLNNHKSMFHTNIGELLNTAVIHGIELAQKTNPGLKLNDKDHIINDSYENGNKLIDIIYNPSSTPNEKSKIIERDIMNPFNIDVIVSGQYFDEKTEILLKPFIIIKDNSNKFRIDKKILPTKNLIFSKNKFICSEQLCFDTFNEISEAVKQLLEQL